MLSDNIVIVKLDNFYDKKKNTNKEENKEMSIDFVSLSWKEN